MTRCLGRNEILNTEYNEFNSVAISLLWHEPQIIRLGQINVAGIRRRLGNVKIALSENIALLLHPQ